MSIKREFKNEGKALKGNGKLPMFKAEVFEKLGEGTAFDGVVHSYSGVVTSAKNGMKYKLVNVSINDAGLVTIVADAEYPPKKDSEVILTYTGTVDDRPRFTMISED